MRRISAILGLIMAFTARTLFGGAAAEGESRFALDLYARLKDQKGDLFFSPYSIHTALAMTAAGARGATAGEMAKVLGLPPSEEAQAAIAETLRILNNPPKVAGQDAYQLSVANALWGQNGLEFRKEFLDLLAKDYQATLKSLDFASAASAAAKAINEWVEEKTSGKIKDLVDAGAVQGAVLVLTNAIYFKSGWETPFSKAATKDLPFHRQGGDPVNIPMMGRIGRFGYLKGEGFQALDIPYQGRELTMTIFLPDEAEGLAALEKQLTAENVARWLLEIKDQDVDARIPRWKTTAQIQLSRELKAMGMPLAFSGSADFSGIGSGPLFVSEVIHKAFIDVDEKGTEAAAATAVVMRASAPRIPEHPKVFLADHPFVYLIRHKQSGAILFLGRVADPQS